MTLSTRACCNLSAFVFCIGLGTGHNILHAQARHVSYELPDENITLKPGKNREIFENNCTACHSSDYITTQPKGPASRTDFWKAEVTKMIKVYGAPVDDADIGQIVDYLSDNY